MNHWLSTAVVATALFLADPTRSQVPPGVFGYMVTGQNGTAGEFCYAFDCTLRPLTVVSGETLTLRVNAPYQNFYAIGASFSATSCIQIPGLENRLVLDPPIVTLALGIVGQPSPILSCWSGFENVALQLPNGLPSGLSFTTQAIAVVPTVTTLTGISFSTAVVTTVQ